jgi:hypothetical protein
VIPIRDIAIPPIESKAVVNFIYLSKQGRDILT